MNLVLVATALAIMSASCGSPSVDLPPGNDKQTSQAPPSELSAPSIQGAPARYPYAKLAIRGTAGNASRVVIEGAGNPVTANVQPVDKTFCVEVELAVAPAHYTLKVRTQASDGRLSEATEVDVDRANDEPPPANSTLCAGSPAGS